MKKLTLLLFIIILLTARRPSATPKPTEPPASLPISMPVEALASSISDLVGVWWFPQPGVKVEFDADGTCSIFGPHNARLDKRNYTFDAGKITFAGSSRGCIAAPTTYEAYVTTQDGKPILLRMQVVGSDPCNDRADLFKHLGRFYIP